MKPFIRLRHVWKVFLMIGIVSLFIFPGVASAHPNHPVIQAKSSDCPSGWYQDPDNPSNCRPNGFCGSASHLSHTGDYCILDSETVCPEGTHPDPDGIADCIDAACGSASHLSRNGKYCIMNDPEVFASKNGLKRVIEKKLNGKHHMRRARNGLYPLLKMSVPQGKIAIQQKS